MTSGGPDASPAIPNITLLHLKLLLFAFINDGLETLIKLKSEKHHFETNSFSSVFVLPIFYILIIEFSASVRVHRRNIEEKDDCALRQRPKSLTRDILSRELTS